MCVQCPHIVRRYPFLLAVDDFQALFSKSAYKSPHFETIKSWHLSMPRLLLDYFSGKRTFVRSRLSDAFHGAKVPVGSWRRAWSTVQYQQGILALP